MLRAEDWEEGVWGHVRHEAVTHMCGAHRPAEHAPD